MGSDSLQPRRFIIEAGRLAKGPIVRALRNKLFAANYVFTIEERSAGLLLVDIYLTIYPRDGEEARVDAACTAIKQWVASL